MLREQIILQVISELIVLLICSLVKKLYNYLKSNKTQNLESEKSEKVIIIVNNLIFINKKYRE